MPRLFGAVALIVVAAAGGALAQDAPVKAQHSGHLRRRHRPDQHLGLSKGLMGYRTPNIDRIADEGAASPTTTPSRAAPPAARPSSPAR